MRVVEGLKGGEGVSEDNVGTGTGRKVSDSCVDSIEFSREDRGVVGETGHDGDSTTRDTGAGAAVTARTVAVDGSSISIGGQKVREERAPRGRR